MGLAELVRKKEISPKEIVDAAIVKIEECNPALNAVIHKMYDQAKTSIEKSPIGGFAGVPILLKNITQEIKDEPLTSGSKVLSQFKAKEDSELVKRIRKTGTVILGQTNVPEFALMGITEPVYYGPTRNPWNLDYTPGGSSGGAAAAVASGMVPIAGANDGGGSIRIPAAFCGLFGMKPSRGRNPVGKTLGRHWQGASADHVLTRSVRDSAFMLNLLKGHESGAAFRAPPIDEDYLECAQRPFRKPLKIAYSVASPIGTEVHKECRDAVMKTVKLLESMGHEVEEKEAPVDGRKIASSYMNLYFGEVAAALTSAEECIGRKLKPSDVEPTTWLLGLLGKVTNAAEFVLSLREWDKAAFAMEEFHLDYDFYVTPTTAYPPSRIGELDISSAEKILISTVSKLKLTNVLKKSGMVDQLIENSLKRTPFTQLANLTGQPAMSVPLHKTKDGLPVGVQFIAARGREDLLFQMAGTLEKTDSWLDVRDNPIFKG
ncbi:amidase [Cytobacillus sp. FJAT-54145]|uniref:Amidase n=1 Tax=Cytobacillus spartinae TaxID=3299023 RepID=A0ABW6K575_9BACI